MFGEFWKKYNRAIICLGLVAVIIVCFIVRLVDWQIVQGEYYRDEVATTANYRLVSDATRGEILDRNGNPIETNATAYSVIIDKLYINGALTENDVIIKLFNIFYQKNASWIDTLPITLDSANNYQFDYEVEGAKKTLETLRSAEYLDIDVYSTAQDYMDAFIERYSLQQYENNPTLCRNLASVRANMELQNFNSVNPYTFAEDINSDLTAIISECSQSMPCIDIKTTTKRFCTDGTLMPHILGITGALTAEEYEENKDKGYSYDDVIGKFGIESAMEDYLKGKGGVKTVSKDKDGTIVKVEEIQPAQPGNTVFLTIDTDLQKATNESLAKNVEGAKEKGILTATTSDATGVGEDCVAGAAVMLSVKDFSVLASATYPTYDITRYTESDYYSSLLSDEALPLYNRAISGSFAPGSVVKPAVAVASLEEEVITEYTPIVCTKSYDYYPGNVVHCMGLHGGIDMRTAIARSCNYYFADMGRRLGIDTMSLYMEKFGLGESTGIEISESTGVLAGRDSTSWLPGNTVQAAIGQSDNTFTPMQLATYVATVANNGVRYRTHLVSKITSYDRKENVLVNDPEKPEIVETVDVSRHTLDVVQSGMRQVCSSGYGTANFVFGTYPIAVAGKTGTAENPGSDHVLFVGYAPYDNPEVAIAVVIEHGANSTFSLNVARDMFDAYFFPETIEETTSTEPTDSIYSYY